MDERPLAKCIICFTSITQADRTAMTAMAVELGATCRADLTADVTHLIAANIQTEKYRYAARHRVDITLMHTQWIPAMHEAWLAGSDIDCDTFIKQYSLPVFFGLRVCVTNLVSTERHRIECLVTQNGGIYTGDLTKDNTHLVAGAANGRKWEAVKAWQCNISVVGPEWVADSITRGASLCAKYYDLSLDPATRGANAWIRSFKKLDNVVTGDREKRKRGPVALQARKNRRTNNEQAHTTLWENILLEGDTMSSANIDQELPSSVGKQTPAPTRAMPADTDDIRPLSNQNLNIEGFDKTKADVLRKVIEELGGICSQEQKANFTIVPQFSLAGLSSADPHNIVTEYWLERCLAAQSIQNAQTHFLSRPRSITLPMVDSSGLSVCTSGFMGVDLLHIERVIKLSGLVHVSNMTTQTSLLIASSRECNKYKHALRCGVRIVSVDWLWNSILAERPLSLLSYAMDGIRHATCRYHGGRKGNTPDRLFYGLRFVFDERDKTSLAQVVLDARRSGAEILDIASMSSATHAFSQDHLSFTAYYGSAERLTTAWLTDSIAACSRLPIKPYLRAGKPILHQKHTNAKHDTINDKSAKFSGDGRSSRRIVGRATTASVALFSELSVGPETQYKRASSQQISYTDPDAIEQQKVLRNVLLDKENHDSSQMAIEPSFGMMTRAAGLDESRRLRR